MCLEKYVDSLQSITPLIWNKETIIKLKSSSIINKLQTFKNSLLLIALIIDLNTLANESFKHRKDSILNVSELIEGT